MKKLFAAFLAALLLLSLCLPVAAAQSCATGIHVTGITLPAAGEKIPAEPMSKAKVKILATVEGQDQPQELSAIADGFWAETDQPKEALKSGSFVAGRSYRFTVTLEFMDAAPAVTDDTEFLINEKKASHLSNEGEKILFYADFAATPGEYTPSLTLKVDGEKEKVYDGKGVTLTAKVDKIEGIDYRYEWFLDEKKLEEETGESLTVKNVAQSGSYYCVVTASLPSDDTAEEKSTKSAAAEIKITRLTVTVDIHDVEKNLFDPDPEFTYDLLGEPYDQPVGELTRLEGEEIGKYSILIGTLAFPEEVADNYQLKVEQGTLSIISAGELPFVSVPGLADQSYITGKSGAKIRVSATKGAIAEDAILSLALSEADAKAALEKGLGGKVLKSFSVKLLDTEGKSIPLPKHAKLRIQIPLSLEEESAFRADSITAGLYTTTAKALEAETVKNGDVSFLTVELEELGTVALFEGEKQGAAAAETPSTTKKSAPEEEKSGALWMWILIVILSLLAVGAIVFTLIQTRRIAPKKPAPKKELTPAEKAEKERARRIAEKINAMPPVPEEKKEDAAMKTRAIPVEKAPKTDEDAAMKTRAVPMTAKGEGAKAPRSVSFEDLEG